jgi:hypothetical protein
LFHGETNVNRTWTQPIKSAETALFLPVAPATKRLGNRRIAAIFNSHTPQFRGAVPSGVVQT